MRRAVVFRKVFRDEFTKHLVNFGEMLRCVNKHACGNAEQIVVGKDMNTFGNVLLKDTAPFAVRALHEVEGSTGIAARKHEAPIACIACPIIIDSLAGLQPIQVA